MRFILAGLFLLASNSPLAQTGYQPNFSLGAYYQGIEQANRESQQQQELILRALQLKQQANRESQQQQELILRALLLKLELEKQRQIDEQRAQRELKEQEELQQQAKARARAEAARTQEEERVHSAISTGTGFFVSNEGYLVTNNHVIEDKANYAIRDVQGRFYKANVVVRDPKRDLALLRVSVSGKFPTLPVADSSLVTKGQRVMTVGYPNISIQGNESKVTDGIISSFSGIKGGDEWFQISVPVQGGNSGGPLVTESGTVVGVVVATANAEKYYSSSGNLPQNINYAIKSNVLKDFLGENGLSATPKKNSGKKTITDVDRATVLVIAGNDLNALPYQSVRTPAVPEQSRAEAPKVPARPAASVPKSRSEVPQSREDVAANPPGSASSTPPTSAARTQGANSSSPETDTAWARKAGAAMLFARANGCGKICSDVGVGRICTSMWRQSSDGTMLFSTERLSKSNVLVQNRS